MSQKEHGYEYGGNCMFSVIIMGLRSHNTCNEENTYMKIYRTILCINKLNICK